MSSGFQRKKTRPFSPIPNAMAQDETLSLGATALICYLISRPDGWKGYNSDIERRFKIGEELRRKIVAEAEREGWLALRRVRKPNGRLDQFYEVQDDLPLPPAERTNSADLSSIPIWSEAEFEARLEGTPPPAKPGVVNHPPADQGVAGQGVVSHPVAGGGDIDNKELQTNDLKKKEGEPSPLLPLLVKKFQKDPLASRKDVLKEPAIRVTIAYHRARSPNTKPTDDRFFLENLDAFANALGYHGLNQEPRLLEEIAADRDRNELPYALLKRLGLGDPPKSPHPTWDEKTNVLVDRGVRQLKLRLLTLDDVPYEVTTNDGQKYRKCPIELAMGYQPFCGFPAEVKSRIHQTLTADVVWLFDYNVLLAEKLARQALMTTKEKLTIADAVNALDWFDVRVRHAVMTKLAADTKFQTELDEARKARKRTKNRETFPEVPESTPAPKPFRLIRVAKRRRP